LIVGDSLTLGSPGASYTARLRQAFPDWRFRIVGRSGETLIGASNTVRDILSTSLPNLVILEIGLNDVLLPYLSSQNLIWRLKASMVEQHGNPPTQNPRVFSRQYIRTVRWIKNAGVGQIIVTTLPCLGEDLNSPLNRLREKYNKAIRSLAKHEMVSLADVGGKFDETLRRSGRSSAYLPSAWIGWLDKWVARDERRADSLSQRRKLLLTIDGVHLNRKGADLFADTVIKALRGGAMKHYFTLEEANMALKVIRPLMNEVLEIRQVILEKQPEIWPTLEKAAGNGGSRAASEVVQDFDRLDSLVHQIQDTGAIIKDINTGLLDFLAFREGREVYLCWQYDEDEIRYWHEIDAGFAGRQLI
jgi:lysophospholipase L1-like esterase